MSKILANVASIEWNGITLKINNHFVKIRFYEMAWVNRFFICFDGKYSGSFYLREPEDVMKFLKIVNNNDEKRLTLIKIASLATSYRTSKKLVEKILDSSNIEQEVDGILKSVYYSLAQTRSVFAYEQIAELLPELGNIKSKYLQRLKDLKVKFIVDGLTNNPYLEVGK